MSEHPKGPNRAAGAFAGAAVAGITALGAGPATQNIPPAPSQRPPAAVAEVTLAPDGGILDPSSTKTPPKTNSDQNPKQELTVEVPGTGKHTGGRVVFGFERDNNGTLNTGEKGPEPGVPARELIPDLMPNLVIGTSSKGGGTEDDGWELKIAQTEKTIQVPVPKTESTFTEVTEEVQDVSKYPIKTPWEQDYKASPELHAEVERAIQECFDQIQQRRELGYLLTSLKIGGLSSDEGNAENPGDPMANLGQHSKLNQDLANQRGLA